MVRSYLSHALNIYLLSYLMTVGSHLLPDTSYLRPAYFYPTPNTSNISRLPLISRLTALVPDYLVSQTCLPYLMIVSHLTSEVLFSPKPYLTPDSYLQNIFYFFSFPRSRGQRSGAICQQSTTLATSWSLSKQVRSVTQKKHYFVRYSLTAVTVMTLINFTSYIWQF